MSDEEDALAGGGTKIQRGRELRRAAVKKYCERAVGESMRSCKESCGRGWRMNGNKEGSKERIDGGLFLFV